MIAKKERLTFTSQIAVWGVERIFDMGSFAVLFVVFSFISPDVQCSALLSPRDYHPRNSARSWLARCGLCADGSCQHAGLRLRRSPALRASMSRNSCTTSSRASLPSCPSPPREGRSFSEGLKTIHDLGSALQLIVVSIFMWVLIAFSYYTITHAYPGELAQASHCPHQVVLMGSSMVGSMLQLPAVGGGSQLAYHQHAALWLRHRTGTRCKLRHADLGHHLYVGDSDRPCVGAARASFHPRRRRSGRESGRAGGIAGSQKSHPRLIMLSRLFPTVSPRWLYFCEEVRSPMKSARWVLIAALISRP